MGAPLDLDQLAESGVLTPEGLARARDERVLPVEGDVTVGDLVAARFGDEVTDRLVEPLLGGVYAGRAREISARAATPQLVALAEQGSILAQADGLPGVRRPGVRGPAPAGWRAWSTRSRRGWTYGPGSRCSELRAGPVVSRLAARTSTERRGGRIVLATPAAPTAQTARRARPGRGARAGRDRVRLGGRGDPGVPRRRRTRAGRDRRLRLPGAAGRGAPDQGVDVLVREVGLGARGRATACCSCARRWAGTARRRPCR